MTSSKPVRFLIVGMQRSGTTVMQELLTGHSDIAGSKRELSNMLFRRFDEPYYATPLPPTAEHEMHLRLFDALAGLDDQTFAGHKIASGTPMQAKVLHERVTEHFRDLKIIRVKRSDALAGCASFYRAQTTNVWHNRGQKLKKTKIKLPKGYITQYIYMWWKINQTFEQFSETHDIFDVSYESDIETGEIFHDPAVFEFLGAKHQTVDWITMKKLSPPLSESIINFEEAREHADFIMAEFRSGKDIDKLYGQYGPTFRDIFGRKTRRLVKHPGSMLSKSFWRDLMRPLRHGRI